MDLEAEFISALCDLRKARKKNKLLKEEVRELKEKAQNTNKVPKEVYHAIVNLMVQLEESKRIEEALAEQLKENLRVKENLEAEIVSLRKDLQKRDLNQSFGNSSKILDQILNNQKSFRDKYGLGYKQQDDNEGSSLMTARNEAKPRTYADSIKETIKKEEGRCQQKPPVVEKI